MTTVPPTSEPDLPPAGEGSAAPNQQPADSAAPAAPADSATPAPPADSGARAPAGRYALGSVPNMLRSMLVIVALMTLIIFLVPRVNSLSGPPVDVRARGLEVVRETGWPLVMPVDLPQGWQASSVRYVRTTGDAMTWLAGYQAPSGNYVSVEQTKDATNAWVQSEINRAARIGTVTIADKEWVKYERGSKVQNSLVHQPEGAGELTTLVTGTATFEEMTEFIGHLRPITP